MITYEAQNILKLPDVPNDKKLIPTIGGKGYRCFLVDKNIDEFQFLLNNGNRLDDVLKPIYQDNYFLIRQSEKYAVPGFYTIQPMQKKSSTTELSDGELILLSFLQQNVRKGLKDGLGVELFGLYTEEQKSNRFISYMIPYHINKLRENDLSVNVYQPHIAEYLKSYELSSVRSQMKIYNNKMSFIFEQPSLKSELQKLKSSFGLKNTQSNNFMYMGRGNDGPEI